MKGLMKKTKENKKYLYLNISFGCVIVGLIIGLIVSIAKLPNQEDQEYLNLREHLLNRFIEVSYGREGRVCSSEDRGLSEDGDIYVKFWCQDYNSDQQPSGDKQFHTLYFNRPYKDGAIEHGYAEALGE